MRDHDETLPDAAEDFAAPPVATTQAGPEAGERIAGRFTLLHELGRGAMGTVWRARHLGLDADVALKLISAKVRDRPQILDRFFLEAKTLAKIKHPNVVRVLDVALPDDEVPYLAMELLEGEDLRSYFDRKGALEPEEAIGIVADLVEGLAAAHRVGVVHRDLKPANIFLAKDQARPHGYRVVVVDFGTALLVDSVDNRLTQAGIVVGTPLYMSPEQAAGDVPSAASDLYAAAVILYELLSEHVPHEVDDFRVLLSRRSTQDAAPIRELRPELPSSYDQFFRRALAVGWRDRFADATEFRAALEPLLNRQVAGFDSEGFGAALDAAIGDVPALPPPAPSAPALDVHLPKVERTPESSHASRVVAVGEAIDDVPAFDAGPALQLDYEAAGLDPDDDAVRTRAPGSTPLRNLLALAAATLAAYFAWVLLGGDPAFAGALEPASQGALLVSAFVWVGVFIVGVVLSVRIGSASGQQAGQQAGPPSERASDLTARPGGEP